MKLKEMIVLSLAVLFLIDSILLTFRANVTLGLFLVWGLTGALFCYFFFHRQIDAFCSHGIGAVLRVLFLCGFAFFVALVALMELYPLRCAPTGEERVVIVLGAGLRGETPSDTLRRRLDAALGYYRDHPGCLLVLSGGQGPDEAIPEAEAMARYLIEAGVPQEDLLLESRSTSTRENFDFSLELLRRRGLSADTPILFVTNRFHCYRAAGYAARAGFTRVRAITAATSPIVLPSSLMREALGICAYWASS